MIEPWSKFYWSDYDADEGLRMCSLAAQGLWMRMLCLMARATPKGELRVGGEPCTVTDLARAVGESEEMVAGLIGELERRGVFSTTRAGVIYSRRLRKDAEISRKRAKSGAKGAAVRYGKEADNQLCNGKTQAKPLAKASPQRPEARGSDTNVSGVPPDPAKLLFDLGVEVLTATGSTEKESRSIIGMWRKRFTDGPVMGALLECRAKTISNPIEWVPKRLGGAQQGPSYSSDFIQRKYAVNG